MTENISIMAQPREETPGQVLNTAIRLKTKAIGFDKYEEFLQYAAECPATDIIEENQKEKADKKTEKKECYKKVLDKRTGYLKADHFRVGSIHSYDMLKSATELFLFLYGSNLDITSQDADRNSCDEIRLGKEQIEEEKRLGWRPSEGEAKFIEKIKDRVQKYFVNGSRLPYLNTILNNLHLHNKLTSIYCDDQGKVLESAVNRPMIELIWSYWHEEGMLAQALNAISLRFQNRKTGPKDPLANLTLNPLRPLSNLIWGYIQDEHNRLSLRRRAYEYDHEYGLSLIGKAVPVLQTSDSRSKFIEAFHNLLNKCMIFYKEENNKLMVPDPFPLLNAVKEVHLLLAEGAHNQFGDLPFQARVEMLMQQWLMARPEMHEFLGRRPMMPYAEGWMSAVDSIKSLQGWTDVSVMHFRDLGVFGEQIILSLRYGDWNNINDAEEARNWALYWRSEIQSYAHAYRVATGVDLSIAVLNGKVDATKPSVHLSRRLEMQLQRR